MQCTEFREQIDSYLKDESLVETNHDVIQHLEACAICRRELTARREIRAQLRRAFTTAPDLQVRPEFAFELRNNLKAQALGKPKLSFNLFSYIMQPQWVAVAACLVVAVMAGMFVLRSNKGGKGNGQLANVEANGNAGKESVPVQGALSGAAVQLTSFEMTELAAGDHRNCAIKYNLPEKPIPLEEAGRKYDAADTGLAQALRSGGGSLAGQIKYVEDHSCVYQGQRFAHVVLEYEGHIVSLLVAGTDAMNKDTRGEAISSSQVEGYQVSSFATKRHMIFVVSDLPEADNLLIARNLSPAVSAHIARAEA